MHCECLRVFTASDNSCTSTYKESVGEASILRISFWFCFPFRCFNLYISLFLRYITEVAQGLLSWLMFPTCFFPPSVFLLLLIFSFSISMNIFWFFWSLPRDNIHDESKCEDWRQGSFACRHIQTKGHAHTHTYTLILTNTNKNIITYTRINSISFSS